MLENCNKTPCRNNEEIREALEMIKEVADRAEATMAQMSTCIVEMQEVSTIYKHAKSTVLVFRCVGRSVVWVSTLLAASGVIYAAVTHWPKI